MGYPDANGDQRCSSHGPREELQVQPHQEKEEPQSHMGLQVSQQEESGAEHEDLR